MSLNSFFLEVKLTKAKDSCFPHPAAAQISSEEDSQEEEEEEEVQEHDEAARSGLRGRKGNMHLRLEIQLHATNN